MTLKMKELMARTQESKSTILYYVQKGLLPQPEKPKFNVHLYDESCAHTIKFIKYLQQNFSYSLLEIQEIFNENTFTFDGSKEMMFSALELISRQRNNRWYNKEDFLKKVNIDKIKCDSYEAKGYFSQRARGYSDAEVAIVNILTRAKILALDHALINDYVESAKALAQNEKKIFDAFLNQGSAPIEAKYELLFDILLVLKPYVFAKNSLEIQRDDSVGEK